MKSLDNNINDNINDNKLSASSSISCDNLRVDCEKCFGLCCVALYFSSSEGFPENKDAGKPCINLQQNFQCKVHENLTQMGLKGCTAYDCFGAGQKVAQVTYNGEHWRKSPEYAEEMFQVFLIQRQLHEMLWYLIDGLKFQEDHKIQEKFRAIISKTEELTNLSAGKLLALDLVPHRMAVNSLLKETSEMVRKKVGGSNKSTLGRKKAFGGGLNLMGADLRKKDLRGQNLSGAFLIAADLRGTDLSGADLIGADLRNADLRGANLTNCIFLTQGQINSAKGDLTTKLPYTLITPLSWKNK
ncbi:uncharacterized protein YjbI with pentapeptide repeats [Clostridium punense]|uniref:Uncharacterized protein YjbI with pentapeptide repeats n=1 Tax=Clostridium punense TaxID=1054297 RepID=A0ABS4K4I7_9CLOT|nr:MULTISPECIES: pentapeptide repeat-containing protein [Clostridium]EQB86324.1 hypothetical protein M918_15410 [Clostridium sp. BL8]MBP2022683.1 uncharacterized protein YjbI with pentapeptide repeats [Clostridium punense]